MSSLKEGVRRDDVASISEATKLFLEGFGEDCGTETGEGASISGVRMEYNMLRMFGGQSGIGKSLV